MKSKDPVRICMRFIIPLLFMGMSAALVAQPYTNAVGVKAGYSSGILFKHFFEDEFSLEGQALYNPKGFQVNGLMAYQFSPYPKERLQYYAGGGVYGGDWDGELAIGLGVVMGSEYVFRNTPLVIGLEWKPSINLFRSFDTALPDIGLTVKVTLN